MSVCGAFEICTSVMFINQVCILCDDRSCLRLLLFVMESMHEHNPLSDHTMAGHGYIVFEVIVQIALLHDHLGQLLVSLPGQWEQIRKGLLVL